MKKKLNIFHVIIRNLLLTMPFFSYTYTHLILIHSDIFNIYNNTLKIIYYIKNTRPT